MADLFRSGVLLMRRRVVTEGLSDFGEFSPCGSSPAVLAAAPQRPAARSRPSRRAAAVAILFAPACRARDAVPCGRLNFKMQQRCVRPCSDEVRRPLRAAWHRGGLRPGAGRGTIGPTGQIAWFFSKDACGHPSFV